MIDHLVDTNLILRRVQPGSPQRLIARRAMRRIISRGDRLYLTAQNLHEFWYVATRPPTKNGLGLTPEQATRKMQAIQSGFRFLPDVPAIYSEWANLVTSLRIIDARSYDARLVAVMRVYGLTHILTFKGADFARFPGITVVDPNSV